MFESRKVIKYLHRRKYLKLFMGRAVRICTRICMSKTVLEWKDSVKNDPKV